VQGRRLRPVSALSSGWRGPGPGYGQCLRCVEGRRGRLDVLALGILLISRAGHSSALMRGELMRYLAELAWAPDAILLNTELRWREDGPDKLTVSAGSCETTAEVALSLDSQGRIVGAFAPDRPRSAKAPYLPAPWRGRFSDYRRHKDMWLTFAGEVGWEIDGVEEIYWQDRMEHLDTQNESRRSAPCSGHLSLRLG
jgi:hypothetical protein